MHLVRRSPLTIVGIAIIMMLLTIAIFAPYLAPYPEDAAETVHHDRILLPPSEEHIFGTDDLGRDIFSRVLFGARISLLVGIIVIVVSTGIGIPLGAVAGLVKGKFDDFIMRTTDIFMAFPPFVLAMVVTAALGPSITNAMIAIAVTWWPWYTRLVRAQTLSIREQPYIEACMAMGLPRARLILRHILPNCLGPVFVQATLDLGYTILTAAALSFLGLGARVPTPEWGLMISLGRKYLPDWWWYATFPGLAIMTTVLGFNLLGDGLRDILDPRIRR